MNVRWVMWGSGWLVFLVQGCANGPSVPVWQTDAHTAQQLAFTAELEGNSRVAQVEWRRARDAVASTARPEAVARMELSRCAVRQAALELQPCVAFQALAVDAAPAEQAYQRYLDGQHSEADVALLPLAHRPVAQALIQQGGQQAVGGWTESLPPATEPLSRLIAASVLVRTGRAEAAVLQQAVDTASAQGWRRPLLAWLTLQAKTARQAGDLAQADRIERRRDLLLP